VLIFQLPGAGLCAGVAAAPGLSSPPRVGLFHAAAGTAAAGARLLPAGDGGGWGEAGGALPLPRFKTKTLLDIPRAQPAPIHSSRGPLAPAHEAWARRAAESCPLGLPEMEPTVSPPPLPCGPRPFFLSHFRVADLVASPRAPAPAPPSGGPSQQAGRSDPSPTAAAAGGDGGRG
jgi:hypothetical protein